MAGRVGFPWTRRTLRWAAFVLASCGGGKYAERAPPSRVLQPSGEPAPGCEQSRTLRARASELLREDRRLAALRAIDDANALCPAERPASLDAEETLRALLDPRGAVSADAGRELLEEARRRRSAGESGAAVLLEERAVVALERALARKLVVPLPSGAGGRSSAVWGHLDGGLLLFDADGVSARRPGEWYPALFKASLPPRALAGEAAVAAGGRWLVVPVLGDEVEAGQRGPGVLASIGLEPGAEFGREGARLPADLRGPWALSSDGSKLVFAELAAVVPEAGTRARPRAATLEHALAIADARSFTVSQRVPAPLPASGSLSAAPLVVGRRFALVEWAGKAISLVELETGRNASFEVFGRALVPGALSPDERYAVWKGRDDAGTHALVIADTATYAVRELRDPDCELWAAPEFDPASRSVAIGSERSRLCLIDLASGRLEKKLEFKSRGKAPELVRAHRFAFDGAGLFATNGIGDYRLFDVKRGREVTVPSKGPQGTLRSVRGRPALASADGSLALISADFRSEVVAPQPGRPDWAVGWTSLENEVVIQFEGGWLAMDATSGASRPLPFPPYTRIVENADRTLIANLDGSLVELYARDSWQRVSGSPRFLAKLEGVRVESGELVFGDARTEMRWAPGFGLRRAARSERDPNAEQDALERRHDLPFTPLRRIGDTRALGRGHDGGKLVVWDLVNARSLGELPLDGFGQAPLALSPGDRFVVSGKDVWDLAGKRKVARLPEPTGSADFWSDELLVATAGTRLTVYAGPRFAPVVALFVARETEAAVAFGLDDTGAVRSLETFGPSDLWDTTFGCGVEPFGVSFRLCRSLFGTSRVLESVFGR